MKPQVKLSRWKPHVQAARRQGKTLAQYAREQGLSAHTLYAAQRLLRAVATRTMLRSHPRTPKQAAASAPNGFTAVKLTYLPQAGVVTSGTITRLDTRLHARLPNGIDLELSCGGTAADALLLKTLAEALTQWR